MSLYDLKKKIEQLVNDDDGRRNTEGRRGLDIG